LIRIITIKESIEKLRLNEDEKKIKRNSFGRFYKHSNIHRSIRTYIQREDTKKSLDAKKQKPPEENQISGGFCNEQIYLPFFGFFFSLFLGLLSPIATHPFLKL
jgi:hypothetical protein